MELNARHRFVLNTMNDYKLYLIVPTIAGMVLAFVYVFAFCAQSWTTRQRLLIRDDLLGQSFKPGQFSSTDTMKSRQETILDIARNTEVIRNTLTAVGPASNSGFFGSGDYPDNRAIEDFQGQISLSAPNGAEFGTTEVMVLSVKASKPDRSLKLIIKLLEEIEHQVEKVRNSQLQSMELELQAARDAAKASLQESIGQLRQMERTLGVDSVTMANMTSSMPGDNSIKSEMLQIQAEKRGFEAQLESLQTSLKTLNEAESNPLLIVSSASSFFRDQLKLSELAKSLVESQKSLALVAGKYQQAHPTVQHFVEQLDIMTEQVAKEMLLLRTSLQSQISELDQRISRLDDLIDQHHRRLMTLNEKRGEHLAINAEIAKRTESLNQYEATLKNIQSCRSASGDAVWVTRMGDPQPSSQPDGLSKRATVMAGGLLGFLFGAGLIVLVTPLSSPDSETRNPSLGIETPARRSASWTASPTSSSAPSNSLAPTLITPSLSPPNPKTASLSASSPGMSSATPAPSEPSVAIPFAGDKSSLAAPRSTNPPVPSLFPMGDDLTQARQSTLSSGPNPPLSKPPVPTSEIPSPSVRSIPSIDDTIMTEQIEKVLAREKSGRTSVSPIGNVFEAISATAQMNLANARNQENNAEELLAELRARRRIDPLGSLGGSSPGETTTNSFRARASQEETQIHADIAHLQQCVGTSESVIPIQESINSRSRNPFLSKTDHRSANRSNLPQSMGVPESTDDASTRKTSPSMPEQIKMLNDTIISLVQSPK
jgi:polysaccharide biosynthesis transport protein